MDAFDDLQRPNANRAQELEDNLANRMQTGNDGFDQPSEDRPTPPEGWVDSLVQLIQSTTGLDGNDSRTVAYFSIATHALPNLEKFPLLAIYGPTSTGKTTLLLIIKQLSYQAVKINGNETKAVLRDKFLSETTAWIDEADAIPEELLVNRYSRDSAEIVVNRSTQRGWSQETINLFGATALHRRTPFKDPAILSRSITVNSRHKDGGVRRFKAADFQLYEGRTRSSGPGGELGTRRG